MGGKYLIGLFLMLLGCFGGTVLTCLWKRSRDFFFFLMIILMPMTERFDINFISRDFYRGTTRGFEFSLVDILSISLLASAVLIPRKGWSRGFWPASFGFLLLFFFYACFNVGMSDPKLFGLFELSKMIRGLIIFLAAAFYVREEREMGIFILAMGLIVSYEGALALQQRYFGRINRVPGTLDDSNSLSVFLCTTAPIFAAAINSRIPKLLKGLSAIAIALACVGVVLTISRMGVVIVALVLMGATFATISYQVTARKMVIGLVVLLGATGIVAKSWKTLESRFKSSTITEEYGSNKNLGRGYYIRVARAIVDDRVLGVGLNNWSYWVSQKYGPRLGYHFVHYSGTDRDPVRIIPPGSNVDDAQAAPAHSLGALTAGELGLPGLILFAFLWMRWFQIGASFFWKRTMDPMHRMGVGIFFALLGIFLSSLTEWVFRHSPIYYTIHVLLGVLASLYFIKKKAKREAAGEALNDEQFPEETSDQNESNQPFPEPQPIYSAQGSALDGGFFPSPKGNPA